MKYLLLMTLFFSSCALFKPTEEQPNCFRDTLSGELFRERYSDEKIKIIESMKNRRQITVDINSDNKKKKSCLLRDQFRTQH